MKLIHVNGPQQNQKGIILVTGTTAQWAEGPLMGDIITNLGELLAHRCNRHAWLYHVLYDFELTCSSYDPDALWDIRDYMPLHFADFPHSAPWKLNYEPGSSSISSLSISATHSFCPSRQDIEGSIFQRVCRVGDEADPGCGIKLTLMPQADPGRTLIYRRGGPNAQC